MLICHNFSCCINFSYPAQAPSSALILLTPRTALNVCVLTQSLRTPDYRNFTPKFGIAKTDGRNYSTKSRSPLLITKNCKSVLRSPNPVASRQITPVLMSNLLNLIFSAPSNLPHSLPRCLCLLVVTTMKKLEWNKLRAGKIAIASMMSFAHSSPLQSSIWIYPV